jgi:ferredoxin
MPDKTCEIAFFSGTGNTSLVVAEIAKVLSESDVSLSVKAIEKFSPDGLEESDVLGLAFPVAAGATYPLVLDFLEKLPRGSGRKVFLAVTMGSAPGNVGLHVRELLLGKGYVPTGIAQIIMPTNFRRLRSQSMRDKEVLEKGLESARAFARTYIDGGTQWEQGDDRPDFPGMVRDVATLWNILRSRYRLSVNEARCTGCDLCAEVCPVGNITMERGLPVFGDNCQVCMRCFSLCPERAITVGGVEYEQWSTSEEPWKVEGFEPPDEC